MIFHAASVKIHNLLGLTARGQQTKANSLPVTLASDEDTLPVYLTTGSDYLGSIRHTWGAIEGTQSVIAGQRDHVDGNTGDWFAIQGANDGDPSDSLSGDTGAQSHFWGGNLTDGTPIWVYIPINAVYEDGVGKKYGGYRSFTAFVTNELGGTLDVTLYAVPTKETIFTAGDSPIVDDIDNWVIASTVTLNDGDTKRFGPNGAFSAVGQVIDMPIGWLVIKAVPHTPGSTSSDIWKLAVQRFG